MNTGESPMKAEEHPDFCRDCREIHADGCPLDFCQVCGRGACICDQWHDEGKYDD